ncbi:cilia- and flagella-associated protein 74 isoform X3 [Manis pentadactyla]|uniref:cilia- and flagella-associated protein 74 isoform X3 n=1 Tax=Manis pentadactyla TaxID=143292 RepID=UPI00255C5357|nr:cilia- and flagella-associated protein 74 isoform X3 [Manis pentadactyla]
MEEDAGLFAKVEALDSVPLVETERDKLEDPGFEVASPPPEAEDEPHVRCSRPEKGHSATSANKREEKTAPRDRIQALHLRRTLDHLEKLHREKDVFIEKTREELRACRQRAGLLTEQQDSVAARVATEREATNMAAVGRLQALSGRLRVELEKEQCLQARAVATLRDSESAMWHIEIQEGRLEGVRKRAQEEATSARRCLQVQAARRLHREEEALVKVERNRLLRVRRSMYLQKEHGVRHQRLVEDAQKNHKVAVKLLKASLGRIREQERKERKESLEHLKRRMEAVLALKGSIAANRETLRKFQAWGQAKAALAEQRAQVEKAEILAHGGDAFKHLFHQRRYQELEAQNRAFEEEQRLRKQEIVSRILKEEAKEDARKKKACPPAKATARLTLRDKAWSYVAHICEGKATAAMTCCPLQLQEIDSPAHPRTSRLVEAVSSESVQGGSGNVTGKSGMLAEPEIPGLWSEDCDSYQVPKEDMDQKPVRGTKVDKDILARTVEQLPSRIVHKQVASGHSFKGQPFHSKPKLIHFKDFDIGKVYKKKIRLVNATYMINYCKLVGVEEHLKDFVHIDFDPPGPMSAGMSCEVLVTFKPMINKDLEGNVSFLAQTGGFSIPLKCSTKKCSVSLDKELVDFGSCVVGETASQAITLTNIGSLGTRFRFLRASESCEVDTSPLALNTSDLFTYKDKGFYDKIVPSFSEGQKDGDESSPLDTPSPKESGKLGSKEPEVGPVESEGMTVPTITALPVGEDQAEISLGEVTEGDISPFSSIRVPIIFTPVIPGAVHTRFKVMFKNQQCPTLCFRAVGVAMDVPVWVPKPQVDLKICMYDRLYQDSVLVRTRSKATLRLTFEVCKELRAHIELLPETGYIQALSSYSVQLKFLPRHSLPEDAGKYFDKETRVLEAPVTIQVSDQIKPVGFTVHAIVTTSDLELKPPEVDFGYCTIYEAIRTQVSLCNHSLLPQEFGFVGLPKFVDIQPNDGFGTILPLETLHLDVTFQPSEAKEYDFELLCKSEISRCFRLTCRAVGVHPPLDLSHHQIKFAATSLYGTSVATLYVINSHLSTSPLTHSVPRIGSEDASPVGPTTFEFLLPPDSPITISPSVGTVLPGKARKDTATPRKDLQRPSFSRLQLQDRGQLVQASPRQPLELQKPDVNSSSDEYLAAQAALARSFQGKFDKFVVPCVLASGDIKDRKGMEPLSFSPHNTLFLELWCPAVAPAIVVTSDKGKTISNFGDIAVGHRCIKKVSIQNISSEDLAVDFSVLNPSGPFVLLNPIRELPAGETRVLALSFSPQESVLAQEMLDIITRRGTLSLTLMGTGVASTITCSIEGGVLNMGYVIARESVSSGFQLQNNSPLPIKFSMRLDSLSNGRTEGRQQVPQFLASRDQRTDIVGTQNLSGQSVFSVVPVEGILEPSRAQDFTVTFSPDHESLYFSDQLQVTLFDKMLSHQILLKGAAREHMMFVEGGDPLDVPVESLTMTPTLALERREEAEELKPILVTLNYVQLDTDTPAPPATRELQVGCIRTTQLTPKKSIEFSLDSIASLQHKGFTIEPSRGAVERGQTKTISISWVPPAYFDPDHPLTASALLQLRGDVKETYKVLLVAQVVTSP